MKKETPRMLIVSELIEDLDININEIEKYTLSMDDQNYKANYIYIYTLFEGAIWQLYKSISLAFPESILCEKNGNVNILIDKNVLLAEKDIIESSVENKLKNLSKENLNNFINSLFKMHNTCVEYSEDCLYMASKIRNSIAHNNSLKKFNDCNQSKLPSQNDYNKLHVEQCVQEMLRILNILKIEIGQKYQKYSYLKLLKDSWNYTVGGYMSFESMISIVQLSGQSVVYVDFENVKKAFNGYSSGEKTMLALWLQQYSTSINDQFIKFHDVNMLVSINIDKVNYFIKLFERFPYLLNGHDYTNEVVES